MKLYDEFESIFDNIVHYDASSRAYSRPSTCKNIFIHNEQTTEDTMRAQEKLEAVLKEALKQTKKQLAASDSKKRPRSADVPVTEEPEAKRLREAPPLPTTTTTTSTINSNPTIAASTTITNTSSPQQPISRSSPTPIPTQPPTSVVLQPAKPTVASVSFGSLMQSSPAPVTSYTTVKPPQAPANVVSLGLLTQFQSNPPQQLPMQQPIQQSPPSILLSQQQQQHMPPMAPNKNNTNASYVEQEAAAYYNQGPPKTFKGVFDQYLGMAYKKASSTHTEPNNDVNFPHRITLTFNKLGETISLTTNKALGTTKKMILDQLAKQAFLQYFVDRSTEVGRSPKIADVHTTLYNWATNAPAYEADDNAATDDN